VLKGKKGPRGRGKGISSRQVFLIIVKTVAGGPARQRAAAISFKHTSYRVGLEIREIVTQRKGKRKGGEMIGKKRWKPVKRES